MHGKNVLPAVQDDAAAAKPPTDATAEKLDSLMELTLAHLAARCGAGQTQQVRGRGCAWLCGCACACVRMRASAGGVLELARGLLLPAAAGAASHPVNAC